MDRAFDLARQRKRLRLARRVVRLRFGSSRRRFPGRRRVSHLGGNFLERRQGRSVYRIALSERKTLGPAIQLGSFTPGVTRTYTAQTTANVISSAGDATLTYSDPSPTNTGKLVNGAFALPQPFALTFSKSSWTAPVSNDVVTISLSQLVNANDALRTGTYSKALTFTLSTTTP